MRARPLALVCAVMMVGSSAIAAPTARAFNPLKPFCKVAQLGSSALSKACGLVSSPGRLLKAGGKLVTGHLGSAVKALAGPSSSGGSVSAKVGLAAVVTWVLGGAMFALHETGRLLGDTTSPQLQSTWFSSIYWRMAAIAALLTVPFLCAAALQAVISGDLALIARATFGYLPLAFLAVAIAAPVTMLLLAASDQLSAAVGSAGSSGLRALVKWGSAGAILAGVTRASPFVAFLIGAIAAGGALVLWIELLMREAAVYIVVMMLPLAFAAMVWPARRAWALRAVELLIALILAKFAIVAVLALGGAALEHVGGISSVIAGVALVLLGAFAPWALLRLIPVTELASGTAGALRAGTRLPVGVRAHERDIHLTGQGAEWADLLTAAMNEQAAQVNSEGVNGRQQSRPALASPGRSEQVPSDEASGQRPAPADRPAPDDPPAPADHPARADHPAPPDRSPGLEPMWQARDLSWRPLTLGLEEGWPPPPLWAPEDSDAGRTGDPASERPEDDPSLPPPPEAGL